MTQRVLVIYKRTDLQRYGRGARVRRLVDEGDATVAPMRPAHEQHIASLERARAYLKKVGVQALFRHRFPSPTGQWDLVVTLGGDGTLLWASHRVGSDVPMVAINSAPDHSVGNFCAGEPGDIEGTLEQALASELKPTKLTRMQVDIDGETFTTRVLNDILFCHRCPAATTRYLIRHGELEEPHTSSGVWVGPAAGSTAAIRSAGGKRLPIGSRRIQYVVREPYLAPGTSYQLSRGLLEPDEELVLRSMTRDALVYADGQHRRHIVGIGSELRLLRSKEPLTLLGLRSLENSG